MWQNLDLRLPRAHFIHFRSSLCRLNVESRAFQSRQVQNPDDASEGSKHALESPPNSNRTSWNPAKIKYQSGLV